MRLTIGTRIAFFVGAVIALIAASTLIYYAGLPTRADYSGRMIEGIGRVAPEINALAPPFEQPDLNGDDLRLLDWRGEIVIVNFWATWCAPCITEMPALQAFHEETGIRVVAINMGEPKAVVADWIMENGLTFDILLDEKAQVARDYQIRGQPSTYVIQPDGMISHIFYGPVTMDDLYDAVNR